jgi:glutathione S-transferase
LTEVGVIIQYLADQKPGSDLAPKVCTMERYRLMEWVNFAASEIHKSIGALFNPKMTPEWKTAQLDLIDRRLSYFATALDSKQYVMGYKFSVADAYLFTVINWTHYHHIDIGKWPKIKDYLARVAARPKVQETMKAEGLIK